MTVRHVAMLRFDPGAAPEARQAVLAALPGLPGQIKEIRRFEYGVGVDSGDPKRPPFDVVVQVDFDDVESFRAYVAHPAHRALITELVVPILADRVTTEFTVEA